MIEVIEAILPYIKGLWTLPWIGIGFLITVFLSRLIDSKKLDRGMKKIGLIILYFFVPLLLFRIFLSVDFRMDEISFAIICILVFSFMYILAYSFAQYKSKKLKLQDENKTTFVKTVLTNQGRSSAFIGGSMLAIAEWSIYAAIYMSVGAIFLFALIPYILSYFHKKEINQKNNVGKKIVALPWYLTLFPWYLISFAVAAIVIHAVTGLVHTDLQEFGTIFEFITSLTIPAALYYVGAGIHPNDLKFNEMKKIFSKQKIIGGYTHWTGIRAIIFLTIILTPFLTSGIFGILLGFSIVSGPWFSVIVINSILPITSTNMFLLPYGIDKKITALSVTWTTIICVPVVIVLIMLFTQIL